MKIQKFIKVEPGENNNKFYDMVQINDNEWIGKYGRVGAKPQETKPYSRRCWESKARDRIRRKGYKDVTGVNAVKVNNELIGDERSIQFTDLLQSFSNSAFKANYIVDGSSVTQAKINQVQDYLNLMSTAKSLNDFNEYLIEVFSILPRNMKRVDEHIAHKSADFSKIVSLEQDNVDVLKGQIITIKGEGKRTLEEAYGLNIEPVSALEAAMLKKLMANQKDRYIEAFKVKNVNTEESFVSQVNTADNKTVWQLFHGSRNENWWSIVNNGLVLHPTSAVITGKMFGYGLYFANKAQKSIGYCSSRGSYWAKGNQEHGLLAVYKVHVGEQLNIKRRKSEHGQLTKERLKSYGNYDSVYAHGGADLRNDEFMVYDQSQATVEYLIKFK
jgi:poly [ADP-ribose] polymerase